MNNLKNIDIYLQRMAAPLAEKLKVAKYFPQDAEKILDVGCADGTITSALADLFPRASFFGIDLNQDFINRANNSNTRDNLKFESVYLRDLLARDTRYDVILFCSVLHEFYTYGEGISSVLKAMADAHELLKKNGVIIIRDMILHKYSQASDLNLQTIKQKVLNKLDSQLVKDFVKNFGELNSIGSINHFLLKYWYTENWDREGKENYTAVNFEQYQQIFSLLGMKTQVLVSYKIEYLKNKWREDFNFTEDELSLFKSTGIIVAKKI